jgi:hypothetical protein
VDKKKFAMAEKQNTPQQPQQTSNIDTDVFVKGMTKDPNSSLVGKDQWTHARNAINNSAEGDVGTLGNEPANLKCGNIPYTVIGTIHLYADKWIIFSTDNVNSEIGKFDDSECKYETLVNGSSGLACPPENCINFNTRYLITGASKENFDCTWQIYWDDGLNPSRTMNIDRIPWKQMVTSDEDDPCVIYEDILPREINCEALRLAPLVDTPCIEISKAPDGGMLRNGSYQAFIGYTINEQLVGDYIGISNIQPLWEHEDTSGSLDIVISNLDKDFEFFQLVILSNTQGEMQAKKIGLYSTEITEIGLDNINQGLETVPIEVLPLRNPAYEKSESMYVVNDYLIRQGPYEQFDFNYQPLANQIQTEWVSVQYPADYYRKGGNKPTFMRDEVYSFFIRFIYNTGERSKSYHIPGRAPNMSWTHPDGTPNVDELSSADAANMLDPNDQMWQAHNTAQMTTGPLNAPVGDDEGIIRRRGMMGYWQSTERYPSTQPEIWGDLCGLNIRHHKFPEEQLDPGGGTLDRATTNNQNINILGVEFSNIPWPRYNEEPDSSCTPLSGAPTGPLIPNILGYEILVGSRKGNKSIIAKGLARNMRQYRLPEGPTGNQEVQGAVTGVMPNYPFNDLRADPFINDSTANAPAPTWSNLSTAGNINQAAPAPANYSRQDIFSFHSPDTSIHRPYLNPYEFRTYGVNTGRALGRFKKSEGHPQQKLLRNMAAIVSIVIGAGYAIAETRGKRNKTEKNAQTLHIGQEGGPYSTDSENGGWLEGGAVTGSVVEGTVGVASAQIYTLATTNSVGIIPPGLTTTQLPTPSMTNMAPGFGAVTGATAGYAAANELSQQGAYALNQVEDGALTLSTALGAPKLYKNTPLLGYESTKRSGQATVGGATPGMLGPSSTTTFEGSRWESFPGLLQVFYGMTVFMNFAAEGGQHIIDLIYNLCSYQDYVYKYNAHGLYSTTVRNANNPTNRVRVTKARYLKNTMTNLDLGVKVNNLFRPSTVAVRCDNTGNQLPMPTGDGSRVSIGDMGIHCTPTVPIISNISAHYCAMKLNFENQYGQLDQIKQVPIRGCVQLFSDFLGRGEDGKPIEPTVDTRFTTDVLFGGDCYINRYTEKVIMPFFWDFLKGQPDGFPYNYKLRANVPTPMFWANFEKYDLSGLARSITNLGFFTGSAGTNNALPNDFFFLDRNGVDLGNDNGLSGGTATFNGGGGAPGGGGGSGCGTASIFHIKNGYMYSHSSGINDFWVESEINVALRDYEEQPDKMHYDWLTYTDVNELFHADIIKEGNFYKYDDSLSKANFNTQLISWGLLQPRDYDPIIAENCFTHYPKRLIYSLQAQLEAKKDFWRVYLPNNYKDFKNKVNIIKPISKSGAMILFPNLAPVMFQGVDQLQTDLGTKLTIGDGGLFSQPMQNVVNAELPHEYGSCESQRSVVNTPSGLFYLSQAQGKVFHYAQGLVNIANAGMKQWFNQYLPSRLLNAFPEIEDCKGYIDNPVAGVGCQSVYDPNFDIVYFCKKDYEPTIPECIDFIPCNGFVYNQTTCDGVPATPCCPDGYDYIPAGVTCPAGFSQVSCLNGDPCCTDNSGNPPIPATVTEATCEYLEYEPAVDMSIQPPCQFDIIFAIDASGSIAGSEITAIRDLVTQTTAAFASQMANDDVRIGIVEWSRDINGIVPLTNSQVTVDNYMNNTYPAAQSSTNPVMGFWWGMEALYGANSRTGIPKKIFLVNDGYQNSPAGSNWSSPASGGFPTGVAGLQTLVGTPAPATPAMVTETASTSGVLGQASLTPCAAIGSGGTPDDTFLRWLNDNIFTNPTYNDSSDADWRGDCEVWHIWLDGNAVDAASINQCIQDYTTATASPGCALWGPLTQAGAAAIANQFIEQLCTIPPEWECPPGCDLINPNDPQPICQCSDYLPVTWEDVTYEIQLDNEQYFEDVSWTVSYDPKSKAWISFHDWHPELTIPSHNHFLTTKTMPIEDDQPYCPPGFTWNPSTQTCCQTLSGEFPATVDIFEEEPNVEIDTTPCLMDISISVDKSTSVTSGTDISQDFIDFVNAFHNALSTEMAAGEVQIGISGWGGANFQTQDQVLTTSNADLTTAANNLTWTSGTNYNSAVQAGLTNLDYILANTAANPAANYLGSRQGQNNFRRVMVIVTDASNACPTLSINMSQQIWGRGSVGCWSGPGTTGTPGQDGVDGTMNIETFAIYATNADPGAYGTWGPNLDCMSGNAQNGQMDSNTFAAWNNATHTALANQLASGLCSLPPVCTCPPGYVRVSRDSDGSAPPYQIDPPCTSEGKSGICRKVECECDIINLPNPTIPITQTGQCDDVILLSDPDYENLNPLTCHYDYECCIPGSNTKGTIWKHNKRCDLFANFYEKDHPWEIEWVESIGQVVNTVRSVEYQLESYIYKGGLNNDCGDRFHDLDWNFDNAIIYNTEQISGLLSLTLDPKNNAPLMTQYPIITGNDIEILYSKEEQKYRFNMFWDITNDRGEFNPNSNLAPFITQLNGYVRDLNQANLNYFKPAFQRKKFRHYWNKVVLRKNISGNRKMLLKLANTKLNMSIR